MKFTSARTLSAAAISALMLAAVTPATADSNRHGHHDQNDSGNLTIYFTRHAEKQIITTEVGAADVYTSLDVEGDVEFMSIGTNSTTNKSARLDTVCGTSKCAEELSDRGELHAELLAQWFENKRIIKDIDAVYATHKIRTQQTVQPTADLAPNVNGVVVQLPQLTADLETRATELNPESTTPSECATLAAIDNARASGLDTIVIAGHSGTLYDIMGAGNDECLGLGLATKVSDDLSDAENAVIAARFPFDEDGKVANFGDLWKVVIRPNNTVRFAWRKSLKPAKLIVVDTAN